MTSASTVFIATGYSSSGGLDQSCGAPQMPGGMAKPRAAQINASRKVPTIDPDGVGRTPEYQAAMISVSKSPSSLPGASNRRSNSSRRPPTVNASARLRANWASSAEAGNPVNSAESFCNGYNSGARGIEAPKAAATLADPQKSANDRRLKGSMDCLTVPLRQRRFPAPCSPLRALPAAPSGRRLARWWCRESHPPMRRPGHKSRRLVRSGGRGRVRRR